tara:strand:+ start:942 stop:1100 length:159 start_codon:yes stop_codon:yes gene_type:complete
VATDSHAFGFPDGIKESRNRGGRIITKRIMKKRIMKKPEKNWPGGASNFLRW